MRDLIHRLSVLLSAAPTWLVAAATICTIVAGQIAEILPFVPTGTAETIATWLITTAGALTAAALVVRRVTPVLEGARGLLPTEHPVTANEAHLADELARLRDLSLPRTPTGPVEAHGP